MWDLWYWEMIKAFPLTYPVATSHILMVLSLEADTMWSPFGMMATDDTLWSWPGRHNQEFSSAEFKFNFMIWFLTITVNSVNISYHALFGCTQTPESPKVWCSCQLNMKPAVFPSGQKRCPAQSLCDPSGFVQSPRPHSPTPKTRRRQRQSARHLSLTLLRI